MARPGSRTAYKGKEARAGYLVGLPVGTGATQGESQSQVGDGPAALGSTDQTGWGIYPPAKVNLRPPTGLTLKSAGFSLIYPLFPQEVILQLLLQDILFNYLLLLLQKEGSVNYWLYTSAI